MSRYTCHVCKVEHGTDNVVAVCVQCYDKLRRRATEMYSALMEISQCQEGFTGHEKCEESLCGPTHDLLNKTLSGRLP